MALEFRNDLPTAADFFALFETTGWNREYGVTPERMHTAVAASWFFVAAYEDGRLVGAGRVVSDGVLHALIVDVIVAPSHQGRGIGTQVMERLLAACRAHRIADVQLFAAAGKAPFYRRLGFTDRPIDAPGMDWKAEVA